MGQSPQSACCARTVNGDDEEGVFAEMPKVRVTKRGTKIVMEKPETGIKISGEGAALCNTPVEQDYAYWEVQVVKLGDGCCIGVARELDHICLQKEIGDQDVSWGITAAAGLKDGDIVSVAFSQDDLPHLKFFINGTEVTDASVKHIKGTVYPCVSVAPGALLCLLFESHQFRHGPSGRYCAIVPPRSMW